MIFGEYSLKTMLTLYCEAFEFSCKGVVVAACQIWAFHHMTHIYIFVFCILYISIVPVCPKLYLLDGSLSLRTSSSLHEIFIYSFMHDIYQHDVRVGGILHRHLVGIDGTHYINDPTANYHPKLKKAV